MYAKYFDSPLVDHGMKSGIYTDESVQSYMFHIINMHSTFARPDALVKLPEITKLVDLTNISRLKSSEDCFKVAVKVFKLIMDASKANKSDNTQKQPQESKQSGEQSGEQSKGEKGEQSKPEKGEKGSKSDDSKDDSEDEENEEDSESGSDEKDDKSDKKGKGKGSDSEDDDEDSEDSENGDSSETGSEGNGKGNTPTDIKPLTPAQISALENALEKQVKFLKGQVDKAEMSNKDIEKLKSIEQSNTEIKVVGDDYISGGVECIVVKNLTKSLVDSGNCPIGKTYEMYKKEVNQGMTNGNILGKKLLTRSESRETVFNRQFNGKIDKRQISSIGYGCENVFFTKEIDMYKKANLHISVDASGSMDGAKWRSTMINIVSIAKAISMIPNLECQISFRTTQRSLPYIVIAYDSRVDKLTKIKSIFPYLNPTGTTPEGLCFESILKNMVQTSKEVDSYFLNLSDGEPYYIGTGFAYEGSSAARHTFKMIKKIKAMNINVLSYYVSVSSRPEADASYNVFKQCYGSDSACINVTHMPDVVKTLNKLFMSKSER